MPPIYTVKYLISVAFQSPVVLIRDKMENASVADSSNFFSLNLHLAAKSFCNAVTGRFRSIFIIVCEKSIAFLHSSFFIAVSKSTLAVKYSTFRLNNFTVFSYSSSKATSPESAIFSLYCAASSRSFDPEMMPNLSVPSAHIFKASSTLEVFFP